MKTILTVATALITGLFFSTSAIAEDAKPAEWLFVHTAETAEMTSATTLVMPVTRDIFAFTDRPNRLHTYMTAQQFVSLWDEGEEGDTFRSDPPNAVLTWVDGEKMKEAEVLITDAKVVGVDNSALVHYSVNVEAGAVFSGVSSRVSLFVDGDCFCRVFCLIKVGSCERDDRENWK
jgi:hypothetical protein